MNYLLKGVALACIMVTFSGCNPESTTDRELDQSIASLGQEIQLLDKEAARYSGGLLKLLILERKGILALTKSMLEQKRESLLRFVSLQYTVNGQKVSPASQE